MLQCEVIGNLGNDAEIKDFGGKKYVSFSVAHSEVSKDQQGNRLSKQRGFRSYGMVRAAVCFNTSKEVQKCLSVVVKK